METLGTLRSFAPAHHNSRAAGLGRITDCFPATSRRWCHLPSTQAHPKRLELPVGTAVPRITGSPSHNSKTVLCLPCTLVGPDRLELSTSVLSGPRSNHLSYGPTSSKLYLCPNGETRCCAPILLSTDSKLAMRLIRVTAFSCLNVHTPHHRLYYSLCN